MENQYVSRLGPQSFMICSGKIAFVQWKWEIPSVIFVWFPGICNVHNSVIFDKTPDQERFLLK